MSEKTEKATAYKLQKAKEKGQVSKSVDLNTCVTLLVMLVMTRALWSQSLDSVKALFRHLLLASTQLQFNVDTFNQLIQFLVSELITLWLPFALASILTIILVNCAQNGFIWSATPLIPDFKRLSVTQGFKKLFSIKNCFEAIKSGFKLTLSFALLFVIIRQQLPQFIQLALKSPLEAPAFMMHAILHVIFYLLLLLGFIAAIDKCFTRWKFSKDQRMSKQEVKDEHKQKEGDPKIKNKRRQLQWHLRQKIASLAQVSTSDVIITNPTHLAIALHYDRETMPAPKVVCKAQGEMVRQVKAIAKKHHIPVIENKAFARLLFQSVELNQWISQELYPIAASVFRSIYDQRKLA